MYGTTWNDVGRTPPHVAWQMLRALRHRPPDRARSGERRETFDAALEQSEQLLTAASMVGCQWLDLYSCSTDWLKRVAPSRLRPRTHAVQSGGYPDTGSQPRLWKQQTGTESHP